MNKFNGLMTSLSSHWKTPDKLYNLLNEEFDFDYDPCPLHNPDGINGLTCPWGKCNFINPPYGKQIGGWINKAYLESQLGKTCVMLLPSRTDTKWWHEIILPYAKEIRFIKGRLKFGNSENSAPVPSVVVIF